MVKNGTVIYAEHPTGPIVPGVTLKYVEEEIDLERVPLNGGVLIKTVALSSDPYMRYRMRDPKVPNFSPHLTLGAPVDNFGVGVVVRSEDPNYKEGDFVDGFLEFREYSIYPAPKELQHFLKYLQKIDRPAKIAPSVYTGTLGLAGKSAFGAMEAFAKDKIKESKAIFVSAAAGPVGTFVCEYAKVLNPSIKVIGAAGSPEKIEILKKIGVDVPINYKTQNVAEVLKENGPIDIYWDNVAGSTLDAALEAMNMFGLIIACGAISQAGGQESYVKNFELVFQKCITVKGFLCGFGETAAAMPKFYEVVQPLVLEGKITSREHKFNGLREAAEALEAVHTGANVGKSVIVVSEL